MLMRYKVAMGILKDEISCETNTQSESNIPSKLPTNLYRAKKSNTINEFKKPMLQQTLCQIRVRSHSLS